MNDSALLADAAAGDRAAFAALYDRHARAVYGYAVRLVGDRTAAEDVTQEAFLALWRSRSYDPSRSFTAWLLTVTRNAAIDHLRRRGRRAEQPLREAVESAKGPVDHVEAALREIPDEYREAVWLCDALGLTYREAADVMGCEPGTVGSRVARGRQLLRTKLARHAV